MNCFFLVVFFPMICCYFFVVVYFGECEKKKIVFVTEITFFFVFKIYSVVLNYNFVQNFPFQFKEVFFFSFALVTFYRLQELQSQFKVIIVCHN